MFSTVSQLDWNAVRAARATHHSFVHAQHLNGEVKRENKLLRVYGVEGTDLHFERWLRTFALQLDPKAAGQV